MDAFEGFHVAALVTLAEPVGSVATTVAHSLCPTSQEVSVYEAVQAPTIAGDDAVHQLQVPRRHW